MSLSANVLVVDDGGVFALGVNGGTTGNREDAAGPFRPSHLPRFCIAEARVALGKADGHVDHHERLPALSLADQFAELVEGEDAEG